MSEDILLKLIEKHEDALIKIEKENAIQNEKLKDIDNKLDMLLKAFNIGEGVVNSAKIFGKFTAWITGICSAAYGLYVLVMDNLSK